MLENNLTEKNDGEEYETVYEGPHYIVTEIAYMLMKHIEEVKQLLNYGEI